jgi:hypothetical protein
MKFQCALKNIYRIHIHKYNFQIIIHNRFIIQEIFYNRYSLNNMIMR